MRIIVVFIPSLAVGYFFHDLNQFLDFHQILRITIITQKIKCHHVTSFSSTYTYHWIFQDPYFKMHLKRVAKRSHSLPGHMSDGGPTRVTHSNVKSILPPLCLFPLLVLTNDETFYLWLPVFNLFRAFFCIVKTFMAWDAETLYSSRNSLLLFLYFFISNLFTHTLIFAQI